MLHKHINLLQRDLTTKQTERKKPNKSEFSKDLLFNSYLSFSPTLWCHTEKEGYEMYGYRLSAIAANYNVKIIKCILY